MNLNLIGFLFIQILFRLICCDNDLNCDFAISNCAKKATCGLALNDFRISCSNQSNGLVNECSQLCQTSIATLLASDEGYQYLNCDCVNNTFCQLFKRRIQICDIWSKNISTNKINQSAINQNSCFLNQKFCVSNPICKVKYQNYRYLCRDALRGEHCSKKCNKSINALSKQIDGISIQDCECDTYLYDLCQAEKHNVLKTCFDIQLQLNNYDMDKNSSEVEVYQISYSNMTNKQIIINNNCHDLCHFELILLFFCLIMAFL